MFVPLDIPSNANRSMEPWTCPPQWPEAEINAHQRSMGLFNDVVQPNDRMFVEMNGFGLPCVFIQSSSKRWYKLETYVSSVTYHDEACGFYGEPRFEFNIIGGLEEMAVRHETDASALVCLHPSPQHQTLPLGDQLVSLTLALFNDRATALRIPLLAQFIAADHRLLSEIFQFSVEGVIRYDDIEEVTMNNTPVFRHEEQPDFYHLNPEELHTMDMWDYVREDHEGLRLDDWFEQVDRTAREQRRRPAWHHDLDQIWKLEERLSRP